MVRNEIDAGAQSVAMYSGGRRRDAGGRNRRLGGSVVDRQFALCSMDLRHAPQGSVPVKEEDHRAFAKGLWWYVIALVPVLVVLVILSSLSQPGATGDLRSIWFMA